MWTPFIFFVGTWQGTGTGQPGTGQCERSYQFVLNDRFLYVKNRSIYPPQEQNFPGEGEVHEDWGFISRDELRNTFVLRQFHGEGFVNQYILESVSEDAMHFIFSSENIENIPAGWRAKETYRVINPD